MKGLSRYLFGASFAAVCATSGTVHAAEDDAAHTSGAEVVNEIIVTARRRSESIQDIPVSVQAISGEIIQKNAITDFVEINKLAPGLQLNFAAGARGANAEVVLRGVRWSSASGNPAIPFYLNEAPLDPNFALLSLFDIGQLEVLRGPQGTTRGAPSISGAITIATRRPDLSDVGGYASGLAGSANHTNFQAAVNVPLVRDVFAVRLAGLAEDSEGNRVHSLLDSTDPSIRTRAFRATALLEPTDGVSVQIMYQHQRTANHTYDHVRGTGSPGFTVAAATGQPARVLPANYNGPAIATQDYFGVNEVRSDLRHRADVVTGDFEWNLGSHTIELIASYQDLGFSGPQSQDSGNMLIGYDPVQDIDTYYHTSIGEARIASNPGDHFLDYVVGAYYFDTKARSQISNQTAYLGGALGAPNLTRSPYVNPLAADAYDLPIYIDVPIRQETYSFYGNLTAHIGDKTELSGGLRWVHDNRPTNTILQIGPGVGVIQSPVCPPTYSVSSIYGAGYCQGVQVPTRIVGQFPYDKTFTPTLHIVSLSHKFTPDIMVYAATGESYRTGTGNINVNVASDELRQAKPEFAKSYEIGLKTSWLNNTLRANVDVFQIDYDGQLTQFPGIQYRNVATGAANTTSSAFYYNVDSQVRGIEVELSVEPSTSLSLNATASYATIKGKGGQVPCNDPTRPLTAANEMNLCVSRTGQVLNAAPKFTATVNGEYRVPVIDNEAFFRFNIAYFGDNPSFQYLSRAKEYALVDLFAGLRSENGAWEAQLFAKNVFDEKRQLFETPFITPASGSLDTVFGPTGYTAVIATRPRELGVQLRYSFGSR